MLYIKLVVISFACPLPQVLKEKALKVEVKVSVSF